MSSSGRRERIAALALTEWYFNFRGIRLDVRLRWRDHFDPYLLIAVIIDDALDVIPDLFSVQTQAPEQFQILLQRTFDSGCGNLTAAGLPPSDCRAAPVVSIETNPIPDGVRRHRPAGGRVM